MSEKPEALRLAENLVNQWYGLMASDSGLPGVSPVIVGALRLDAAAELRRLHTENERLREEVRNWKKSFVGHVYVKNEDYAELISKRDALKTENERLREALAWAYNLRHLRGHSDPVVIPERFAPLIEAALRREEVQP